MRKWWYTMTKIIELTPTRLRLQSRPSPIFVALIGVAFLAYVYWLCPSYRLVCQGTEAHVADVQVVERLFGVTLSQRTIRGVQKALLEMNPSSPGPGWRSDHRTTRRGRSFTYDDTSRIVFVTGETKVPLTASYSTGFRQHQAAVDAVNQFLASGTPRRATVELPTSGWIWAGAAFLAFAFLGLLFLSGCDCLIDRDADQVRLTWKGFLGTRAAEYRLGDVERFQIIDAAGGTTTRIGTRVNRTPGRSLGMRLLSGQEVSLTRESSPGSSARLENLAAMLDQFRVGRLGN